MRAYLDLGNRILEKGVLVPNRTGVDTVKVFGEVLRFDLSEGFPLVTTKKVDYTKPLLEFLWFLRGPEDGLNMNVGWLHEHNTHFWDDWADEEGSIGPCYGSILRGGFKDERGENIDQISILMDNLKNDPLSRRHVVSLWHPSYLPDEKTAPRDNPELGKGSLAPCFWSYTIDLEPTGDTFKVNLHVNARSSDYPVGLPFNIAQFAAFNMMLANQLDYIPGELFISITNAHIYVNQEENVKKQLTRQPYDLPKIIIKRKAESIFDYTLDDFELVGYECHPGIRYEVAV